MINTYGPVLVELLIEELEPEAICQVSVWFSHHICMQAK